jgi:hypothetical protein
MSTGLRNPRRSVRICIAMLVVGIAGILWGIYEMNRLGGAETGGTATAIGVGLLLTILGALFLFNFLWAVRLTEAMQRGENIVARWTVPPQTLEEFREDEEQRKKAGRPNDWKVPRKIPAQGLEVIFSPTAVMIGDTFFGLSKGGLARFTSIQTVPGNPLSIGFGMAMTTGRSTSTGATLTTIHSELRIPIARMASAEASKVIAYYTSVDRGETIARPGFWALRVKIGLWGAGIGAASFAIGMALNALKVDLGLLPLFMAVIGGVIVPFGLLLAFLAWRIGEGEKRRRK